jgi:hypothetical protein
MGLGLVIVPLSDGWVLLIWPNGRDIGDMIGRSFLFVLDEYKR